MRINIHAIAISYAVIVSGCAPRQILPKNTIVYKIIATKEYAEEIKSE